MGYYRHIYKRYYQIDFNDDFVVHHIDLNRQNNDIKNLLLLPKTLHQHYHLILNSLTMSPEPHSKFLLDLRLNNIVLTDYYFSQFKQLPLIIEECHKWLEWKHSKYDLFIGKMIFNNNEILGGIKHGCNKSKQN